MKKYFFFISVRNVSKQPSQDVKYIRKKKNPIEGAKSETGAGAGGGAAGGI